MSFMNLLERLTVHEKANLLVALVRGNSTLEMPNMLDAEDWAYDTIDNSTIAYRKSEVLEANNTVIGKVYIL